MAITLNATAGSASANSYCTVTEADTYHKEKRYHSKDTWLEYSSDEKKRGLIWATRLLDERITWVGAIVSSTQALRWPRAGAYDRDGNSISSSVIPQFLKDAVAEYAYFLMASDRMADSDTAGFKEIEVGSLRMVVDKFDRPPTIPDSVISLISYYGAKSTGLKRVLIRM
jgi:hypothetical protein